MTFSLINSPAGPNPAWATIRLMGRAYRVSIGPFSKTFSSFFFILPRCVPPPPPTSHLLPLASSLPAPRLRPTCNLAACHRLSPHGLLVTIHRPTGPPATPCHWPRSPATCCDSTSLPAASVGHVDRPLCLRPTSLNHIACCDSAAFRLSLAYRLS